MKKVFYLSVCALALVAAVACNNNKNLKNAGNTAREYAMDLQSGNYSNFVSHMSFGTDYNSQELRDERSKYVMILNDKIDPIIRGKGGIRDIRVLSESGSNEGQTATVVLRNVYNNGQTEEVIYDLVWADNQWRIDMDKNRQVWNTTTADGREVSFTIKDYDNKEVFKQNMDGERSFVKMKDEDDRQVVKTLEDGEREVSKVIENENDVVVKEKDNQERDVTRIPTK